MTAVAVVQKKDSISLQDFFTEKKSDDEVLPIFSLNHEIIKQCQLILKDKGFYNGKISGRLNGQLKKSLTKYQKINHLPSTGMIDERLFERLLEPEELFEIQPDLPFADITNEFEENSFSVGQSYGFLPTVSRPASAIHISYGPKQKTQFFTINGKDDFLFIGVFLLLVALSLIGAFFIS